MYIWKVVKAGKTTCYKEWNLSCISSTIEYYSNLRKVKAKIKKIVKMEKMSKDNWTEEQWITKDYCTVINSGGREIFSIQKIYVK